MTWLSPEEAARAFNDPALAHPATARQERALARRELPPLWPDPFADVPETTPTPRFPCGARTSEWDEREITCSAEGRGEACRCLDAMSEEQVALDERLSWPLPCPARIRRQILLRALRVVLEELERPRRRSRRRR